MLNTEHIAQVVHAANREYCLTHGDNSILPWDIAPAEIKQSAIDGVNYYINNPNTTPEQTHENWCKFKLAQGWIFGKTKDPLNKTHPCLVPYNDLPEHQKMKDHLFLAIVKTLINSN